MATITPVSSPSPDRDDVFGTSPRDSLTTASEVDIPQIGNYVALGCLVVDLFSSGLLSPPIQAQPRTVFDHISHFDFPLRNAVTTLLDSKWIRVFSKIIQGEDKCILRVYGLPQDAGRSRLVSDRNTRSLQSAFEQLLMHIDVSESLWDGLTDNGARQAFDLAATPDDNSLFYIFNTLPSPAPSPSTIRDRYSRAAAQDLLAVHSGVKGLKTVLYPYQARSAAMMLQRESTPELTLDPRLDLREGPNGDIYYYGPRDGSFLKQPRLYESVRGGILSETMGLG